MTKRVKQVLFYSAVAFFLISNYVIILYAQGYKYSFLENRFFRTGAIYLKTNTTADVYVDDKLLGNTSFFNNSYRLEGLLPGRYIIRIQQDDYSIWQKSVTVDEGFVSEFSKILLLSQSDGGLEELDKEISLIFPSPVPAPSSLTASASQPFVLKKGALSTYADEPEKIAENVKGFALSKDKNKLAWWTANEIWVMWLKDAGYQPYHKKGDKELITRFSTQIKKAAWFRDEDHLIVDSGGYKILETDIRGGINIFKI
ncbi:MAG: hypothetical protein AAB461_02555 [Patescibacteria group bacterium]